MVQHLRFAVPPEWDPLSLLAGLKAAGYEAGAAQAQAGRFLFFDTRDGILSRTSRELRREEPTGRWLLFAGGRQEPELAGRDDEVPAGLIPAGPGRPAPIWLPLLQAESEARLWMLRSPAAPPIGVVLESWRYSSALDPLRRSGSGRLLALASPAAAPSSPVPVEVAYLAGLLESRFGLQPQGEGLLPAALRDLGVEAPWEPLPAELRPGPSDAPEETVRKVLAIQACQLRRQAPGALLDLDPEFLHLLRVATRRARTALRLFSSALDPQQAAGLDAELAWVARSLGPARDLDVFLQRLADQLRRIETEAPASRRILGLLQNRRQALHRSLEECLLAERFRLLAAGLGSLRPLPAGVDLAPRTILPLLARVRRAAARAGERPEAAQLHRLRIRLKRLRYACEFFLPRFGPVLAREIRRLVELQDLLGAGQDAASALAELEELCSRSRQSKDLLALGALMQVQREVRRESENLFLRRQTKLPLLLERIRKIVEGPG